jgi:HlyD family secretion protein
MANSKGTKKGKTTADSVMKNLPQNMSQDQMQKLISAMQHKQLQEMPKHKRYFMKAMQYLGPKMQEATHQIDRAINFITQKSDTKRNDVLQSARGPILFGMWVAIIFFGVGGMWAAIAPLDSASPAVGTLISSTNIRTLQHKEGGTIKEIFVKQGDKVKKGSPIIAFEETHFKAQHDVTLNRYRVLKAAEGRLKAERDDLPYIEFSSKLLKDAEKYEVAKIIATERQVFQSRKDLIENFEKHTAQRISQNTTHIEGLKEKKVSAAKAREVFEERLEAHKALFKKGIISKAQMSEVERQYAEAKSNDLVTDSEILSRQEESYRIAIELAERKSDMLSKTVNQLEDTQQRLEDARQSYIEAKDAMDRIIVTSPVDGIVNDLKVKTVGSVVGQGAALAEISPVNDVLIVETKISPRSIAYIGIGMKTKLRFSAFKSRTTPVFDGTVVSLSPDVIQQQQPSLNDKGQQESAFYVARVEIDMDSFKKEAKRLNLELLPGMQAEVQIITGTRTLLRYLLDPITDNMFKAFNEK